MTIIFAGTPDFARESLAALLAGDFVPELVLTQPDRPAGRGKKLTPSPVKVFAEQHGIPVWQPVTLRDPAAVAEFSAWQPDLLIVAAYGLLLPQAVLDIPRRACINVHASLLPRWRGASPIQAAILAGDAQTGISLMQMEAGLDSGPILASKALDVAPGETAGSLHDRLAALGASLLVRSLPAILDGSCEAVPQDPAGVTYAGKIRSEDALLDWRQTADFNARKVRAYDPQPGAWFCFGDERIKCWAATVIRSHGDSPGKVITAGPDGIDVACASNALRMIELQRPGRRRVNAGELAAQLSLSGEQLP